MKKLLLTTALAAVPVNLALAQSNQEAAQFVTGGIAMINAEEQVLTIGNQEIGSDNSLTLSDIKFTPEDDVTISTDWIKLTPSSENDQDVIITFADEVSISGEDSDGEHSVVVSLSNMQIVTNLLLGPQFFMDPSSTLSLQISADEIDADASGLNVDEVNDFDFNAKGFSLGGDFTLLSGDLNAASSFDNLSVTYDFVDDYSDGSMKGRIVYDGFGLEVSGKNLPTDESGLKPFVDDNGEFKVTFTVGASEFDMSSLMPEMPIEVNGSTGPGAGEISFIDGVLVYAGEGAEAKYVVKTDPAVMPIPPFEISVAGARINISAPLRPTEDMQQSVFQFELRDLIIDETLWAMADPTGNLAHDAINIEFDIASEYRLDRPLVESIDEDGVDDVFSPIMLGQINSVDINRIFLTIAGAVAEANGGFTFDNAAGFPVPNGSIDISLKGIQAITDHLVSMGLLDETEVAMGMGMAMAFMKPGDEPDSFTTTIEVDETGVKANGVPLPN